MQARLFLALLRKPSVMLATGAVMGSLCFASASGQTTQPDRDKYSSDIAKTYNFHFGESTPFIPGSAQVEGNEFIQAGAFPNASIAGTAIRRLTVNGARRCIPIRSARHSIAPASTS